MEKKYLCGKGLKVILQICAIFQMLIFLELMIAIYVIKIILDDTLKYCP